MEVKAGNDVFRFAERYGDRLMFVGGLDERILESKDRAVIRKGVTDFMRGMKAAARGRLRLGPLAFHPTSTIATTCIRSKCTGKR